MRAKGSGFCSFIIGREDEYIGQVSAGVANQDIKKVHEARRLPNCVFRTEPKVNQGRFKTLIANPEIGWIEPMPRMVNYLELDSFGLMRHASFGGLK